MRNIDPDSDENQKATRENEREIFALRMQTWHDLEAHIDRLKRELDDQNIEIKRLRTAIERALAWGPDVTVCDYLREALK